MTDMKITCNPTKYHHILKHFRIFCSQLSHLNTIKFVSEDFGMFANESKHNKDITSEKPLSFPNISYREYFSVQKPWTMDSPGILFKTGNAQKYMAFTLHCTLHSAQMKWEKYNLKCIFEEIEEGKTVLRVKR